MVENGYLEQERSVHDRRSIHVRLTEKGRKLRDRLTDMHTRHIELLSADRGLRRRFAGGHDDIARLERFWIRAGDLVQRPGQYGGQYAA